MPAKPVDPTLARLLESHRFQRSFWVLILMITYDPQPVGRDLLAAHAAISKPTAAQYLDDLARLDLIIRQGVREGYVLTNFGRQLVMSFALTQKAGQPEILELEAENSESQKFLLNPLKKERIINDSESDSFLLSSGAESKILTLLENTGLLFDGHVVNDHGLPIERLTETVVLGYLAHALQQKRLAAPAAFVYMRLKSFGTAQWKNPSANCMRDYLSILPAEYLKAVGLLTFKCECGAEFGADEAAFGKHVREQHPEPEVVSEEEPEMISIEADETVTLEIKQAWQSVVGQLAMDMPKASFDTWLRDTEPVRFADGALDIGCRNSYTCDWLESRITKTAERLLVGIMNENVVVNFVVARVALKTEV
jgi:predicted transcriptional regulator